MEAAPSNDAMLTARLRVPEHVVYRDFDDETVVLNLDSGQYHGLNPTAAAMLSAVDGAETVGGAAKPPRGGPGGGAPPRGGGRGGGGGGRGPATGAPPAGGNRLYARHFGLAR